MTIGALVSIRFPGRNKPQLVRIIDREVDSDGRVWFWAKYA